MLQTTYSNFARNSTIFLILNNLFFTSCGKRMAPCFPGRLMWRFLSEPSALRHRNKRLSFPLAAFPLCAFAAETKSSPRTNKRGI